MGGGIMARDWRKEIEEKDITFIDNVEDLRRILDNEKVLITSRCSQTKTGKDKAIPRDFYVSNININFYEAMEKNNFYYGILSDKYGIHFADEKLDYYDIHPSELTTEEKQRLGKIIGVKTLEKGYDTIIFYNTSPLLSAPYFEMLEASGLKIYFISDLNLFPRLKQNKLF